MVVASNCSLAVCLLFDFHPLCARTGNAPTNPNLNANPTITSTAFGTFRLKKQTAEAVWKNLKVYSVNDIV